MAAWKERWLFVITTLRPLIPRFATMESIFFAIQPNPSQGHFTLNKKNTADFSNMQLQIFDAAGKQLSSEMIDISGPYHFGQDLHTGIYFARLIEGKQSRGVKIIKL